MLLTTAGWAAAARSCGPDSPNNVYLTPDASYTACRKDVQDSRSVRNGGLVALGIGVALTATGALLHLANLESKVDQGERERGGTSAGTGARPLASRKDASLRLPEPPIATPARAAGEVHLPVLDVRF